MIYCLYLLGGDSSRIHTEDIAIKCFQLFPHSFSWTKYKEYPDKDIVRVALTDARKGRFGPFVEGRSGQKSGLTRKTNRSPVEDGWILTPQGIDWIRNNVTKFKMGSVEAKDHRQQVLRQLKIIRGSPVFFRYMENPIYFAPAIGEIAEMLRCRVDAEQEVWISRFNKIELRSKSAAQKDVMDFIEKCKKAYFEQK